MAAPRPTWRGYLKLALVSCPVSVYTATSSSERVRFNTLNRSTGNRVRQSYVDDKTREPVAAEDKIRGYQVDKDIYVQVEDEELDAIAIESSHTIDIDVFVPKNEIDPRYLDAPYYVAPNDRVGAEAFVTMREAMGHKGMVALARVVLAKRERVVALEPWGEGMLATTLRYPYEIREEAAYFADVPAIKTEPALMSMAEQLVDSRVAGFDPSKFRDRYEEAVVEMLERKKAGLPKVESRTVESGGGVIDFAEALKRSLGKQGKATASPAASEKEPAAVKPKKAKKRVAGQAEMLMPITGKQTAEKAAKKAAPAATSGSKRKAS